MRRTASLLLPALFASTACAEVDLDLIELPEGFSISIYADGVENARQMAWGDEGTLFVGSRKAGKIHAVVDSDGDHRADEVHLIMDGLKLPSGIAFHDGSLYIADIDTIHRLDDIEAKLTEPPEPVTVIDTLPSERHHGWKYIAFGPDDKLYVPVGAPCNVCSETGYAEIRRMNPDGSGMETVAYGVRNTVGFDWHPETGELWFTDNGRDMMGDDIPPCELNRLAQEGAHFGFPHCHGSDVADPDFGDASSCGTFTAPAQELGPHVAPLGMKFYRGDMFPAEYRQKAIIAEHGSWNRSSKIGYRLTMVTVDEDSQSVDYRPFATGWLQGEVNWGRPVDVIEATDGSLLVSDDQAGVIYRITWQGS
ncbi:MAG: sorbosone dehydrogenase family protein [Pseudomonadota bacterium]